MGIQATLGTCVIILFVVISAEYIVIFFWWLIVVCQDKIDVLPNLKPSL